MNVARYRPDRRRIKIHRSYTVDEAAQTLGTAKGTIRRWLKKGLALVDARKPALIRGLDLAAYLSARIKPKQPCPPGHCYCVKCKAPKEPAGAFAEYIMISATSGNLRAVCPSCESLMHRRTSRAHLEQLRGKLDVTIVERIARIDDSHRPSSIEH
ncbi:MAG: helix-turn-helix domain-containing protein [Legionella sp.]|nr:helix-turn-helix domain-containing protein [Legionella sp.]